MSNILLMHDFPDPTAHNAQRLATTTALQGLYALNGPLLLDRAAALVKSIEQLPTHEEKIEQLYLRLFSRSPTDRERAIGLQFVTAESNNETHHAWQQYAHVLLASNEFLYVE